MSPKRGTQPLDVILIFSDFLYDKGSNNTLQFRNSQKWLQQISNKSNGSDYLVIFIYKENLKAGKRDLDIYKQAITSSAFEGNIIINDLDIDNLSPSDLVQRIKEQITGVPSIVKEKTELKLVGKKLKLNIGIKNQDCTGDLIIKSAKIGAIGNITDLTDERINMELYAEQDTTIPINLEYKVNISDLYDLESEKAKQNIPLELTINEGRTWRTTINGVSVIADAIDVETGKSTRISPVLSLFSDADFMLLELKVTGMSYFPYDIEVKPDIKGLQLPENPSVHIEANKTYKNKSFIVKIEYVKTTEEVSSKQSVPVKLTYKRTSGMVFKQDTENFHIEESSYWTTIFIIFGIGLFLLSIVFYLIRRRDDEWWKNYLMNVQK